MKANEVILNTFLSQSKTQFVIPVYQRNYDWTEQQCSQLFQDILEVGKKKSDTHFIGSIVYIHEGVYTSSEVKKLVIIDGQQRLTTLSLLYLALFKFAAKNGLGEHAEEIRQEFLTNKFVKEDASKLKLKQSDTNARAFAFILSDNDPAKYSQYSRVIENFNFFFQNISLENFDIIRQGISCLLFVEISLERNKDDPQRIFESLNSTGLELSQADLIRNYILMGLEPDEQVRIFNIFWEIIESNARDLEKEESRVSDFIRDYLTLKNKKIPNKGKVYEEFKSKYPNRDEWFYKEVLSELKEFSYYYQKLINPSREENPAIRRELEYIQKLEVNICFPFLMPVFADYRENLVTHDDLLKILRLIQSYSWRRFITNLPTASINKLFMTLYGEVDRKEYLGSIEKALAKKKGTLKFPTNEEIEVSLFEKDIYNSQAKNRSYFLELLENHNNREYVSVDTPEITIEHIFPQNPDQSWYDHLPPEDRHLFTEKYLHTIANLTLSGNNGSLSNKSFLVKKLMNKDGGEQGYNFSRLWLNQFLRNIDDWNIEQMKLRYRLLLDRFFQIWSYPDVDIEEELEADEDFTIYNAPDPKNRKLDYFIFRDQKIETNEVTTMYTHVMQQLYIENPSAFHHQEVKDILGLSSNKEDFRACHSFGPGYFMEMNLSNTSKFSRLKKILTKFNAEEDLLVNFSSENLNAELFDPTYWIRRTSADIFSTVELCFKLINEIDPSIQMQHRVRHVGLKKGESTFNFVFFAPTSSFVRLSVRLEDPDTWIDKLKSRNIEFLSINKRTSRLKFRVTKEVVANNDKFLKEMLRQAYNERVLGVSD